MVGRATGKIRPLRIESVLIQTHPKKIPRLSTIADRFFRLGKISHCRDILDVSSDEATLATLRSIPYLSKCQNTEACLFAPELVCRLLWYYLQFFYNPVMTQSESSKENRNFPLKSVTITDEFGRSLACYIEHSFELNDENYVLLLPVDRPVEIFSWPDDDDDSEPISIEEPADIDDIFETAKAVLEEQNLTLKRTAVTLTVSGDMPELLEDELDDPEEEEGYEELQLLASFYNEEQEYAIYTPIDPFLILGRLNTSGEPQLLSDEELEQLEPMLPSLEAMLEEHLFNDMN